MKANVLCTFFALLPWLAAAQKYEPVVIGEIRSVSSKILQENRKIWIYDPSASKQNIYQQLDGHPVIYVLDGDDHFHSLTGLIQYMSSLGTIPPMIVVAIPNTNRMRDLTPTPLDEPKFPPSTKDAFKDAGGGEKFTDFLQKELIPYIDSHYRTHPYRIFIGHSLGGLMAVNTLLKRPNLFQAYLAIDPSMWWNQARLVTDMEQALQRPEMATKTLFVSLANNSGEDLDTALVSKGQIPAGNKNPNVRFAALLKSSQNKYLRAGYVFYKNETHPTVPLPSEYDGLRFIFNRYQFSVSAQTMFEKRFKPDSAFVAHYKEVSRWMGYRVSPPEPLVNEWVYNYMTMDSAKSLTLLRLNQANYPKSSNVFDSLGDYYVAQKDTSSAIAQFQKALSLKETAETRRKLTELQTKAARGSSPANKFKK